MRPHIRGLQDCVAQARVPTEAPRNSRAPKCVLQRGGRIFRRGRLKHLISNAASSPCWLHIVKHACWLHLRRRLRETM